jgi:hypothetical protein
MSTWLAIEIIVLTERLGKTHCNEKAAGWGRISVSFRGDHGF